MRSPKILGAKWGAGLILAGSVASAALLPASAFAWGGYNMGGCNYTNCPPQMNYYYPMPNYYYPNTYNTNTNNNTNNNTNTITVSNTNNNTSSSNANAYSFGGYPYYSSYQMHWWGGWW